MQRRFNKTTQGPMILREVYDLESENRTEEEVPPKPLSEVLKEVDSQWQKKNPAVFQYYVDKIEKSGIKTLDDLLAAQESTLIEFMLPKKVQT